METAQLLTTPLTKLCDIKQPLPAELLRKSHPAAGSASSAVTLQQRCRYSSARPWEYVHLNQCISSSGAHGSATKYRSWKRSLTRAQPFLTFVSP